MNLFVHLTHDQLMNHSKMLEALNIPHVPPNGVSLDCMALLTLAQDVGKLAAILRSNHDRLKPVIDAGDWCVIDDIARRWPVSENPT